jgi:hypothetical protein
MSGGYYVLDADGIARPVKLLEWAKWYESADRRVAWTAMLGLEVSTVFLGLDHSFGAGGPPVLFETMIFCRGNGGYMQRYCNRGEALEGHENLCKLMRHDLKERRQGYSQSHWRGMWRRRWA